MPEEAEPATDSSDGEEEVKKTPPPAVIETSSRFIISRRRSKMDTSTSSKRSHATNQPTPAEKNKDQTTKSWQVFTKKPYLCRSCSTPYMHSPFNLLINYMSSATRMMHPAGKLGILSKLTWKKQVRNLPRQKENTTANGTYQSQRTRERSQWPNDPFGPSSKNTRMKPLTDQQFRFAQRMGTSPTDSPINESQCQKHQRPS